MPSSITPPSKRQPVILCDSVFKIFGDNAKKMLSGVQGNVDAKAFQDAGCIVGVKRRKNQMARQRSLDGNIGRFLVADLSHKDNIGVLTQDRTQASGKREIDLGVDFDLTDTRLRDFDGLLNCDDVFFGVIDFGETCVESGCFSASCRSSHKEDSVGPSNDATENSDHLLAETDFGQVEKSLAVRKESQDQTLTKRDGECGESYVVVSARNFQPDSTILGQSLLGDIEAAHDLDARSNACLEAARERLHRFV